MKVNALCGQDVPPLESPVSTAVCAVPWVPVFFILLPYQHRSLSANMHTKKKAQRRHTCAPRNGATAPPPPTFVQQALLCSANVECICNWHGDSIITAAVLCSVIWILRPFVCGGFVSKRCPRFLLLNLPLP